MQILSKRFYHSLIPQFLNFVHIPLPPQFIMVDTNKKEVHTYYVDEVLNPLLEWTRNPLKISGSKYAFSGGFKIVATSELGGRYFLCGGQRVNLNKGTPAGPRGLLESSPCFEYTLQGFEQKRDMVNVRTYFSLVCLTKLEYSPDYLNQASLKSRSL